MILSPELVKLRAARPAFYAAFDALGKAGAVEIEFLWPAVRLLAEHASEDFEIEDADLIAMGALLGAARTQYPSVEATVIALLDAARVAHIAGRPIAPSDFGPVVMAHFDELIGIASQAACAAAAELDLYR